MSQCITDKCTRQACQQEYARGLCLVCYSIAKKMIESKQTTWEELEKLGLIRPTEDPFTKSFESRHNLKT